MDKAKELAMESVAKATNLEVANNVMNLVLKTFTVDTFNFYDYSKLTFIQIMSLVNNGIITDSRAVEIEQEVRVLLNELLSNLRK